MTTLFFILIACTVLLMLYLLYKFFSVAMLSRKLRNANLFRFKKALGNYYQIKTLTTGFTRYKWSKRWLMVKADFDKEGNLRSEIAFYIFWDS